MSLRYVITGCAASGTGWAAAVMRELGSRCGHERVFTPVEKRQRDGLEGDSSWLAIHQITEPLRTLVLIRNPLHVVRSISQMKFLHDQAFWSTQAAQGVMPDLVGVDWATAAMRYVARWDTPIPEAARVQPIEQIDATQMRAIYGFLTGRNRTRLDCRAALRHVGRGVNSHRGRRSSITWDDIRNHPEGAPVIAKAERWGYL